MADRLVILLAGGSKRRQDADIAPRLGGATTRRGRAALGSKAARVALTRSFKETVNARVASDPAFKEALLTEGLNALLEGDLHTGKAVLRDYINATVGFEALAEATGAPAKSLMRMFSPRGSPSASNLFAVVRHLQRAPSAECVGYYVGGPGRLAAPGLGLAQVGQTAEDRLRSKSALTRCLPDPFARAGKH